MSVAPYDVRQGNFVGAGVNTVTRSGTNRITGSFYYRYRDDGYVGTEAAGLPFNPGTFTTKNTGFWVGGPFIKNRLFGFTSFEKQEDTRPLSTFVANPGGAPAQGNTTRVLASDLNALSSFLSRQPQLRDRPVREHQQEHARQAVPDQGRLQPEPVEQGDVPLQPAELEHRRQPVELVLARLRAARRSRTTSSTTRARTTHILENIHSGIGEWNSTYGSSMSNSLIVGYTKQDESRGALGDLFPFVDILDGAGTAYTSFGSEPFTPNNELRYNTFQLQDSFTKFGKKHTLTFGGAVEKYHSENVFFPGKQSAYVYNSLADFYTDAADFLANPNRTTSPITLRRFQVRYMNIPGLEKPVQPLDVWYSSAYVQDEFRPLSNLTITAGVRFDIAAWGETAYANANVDALTFRDPSGSPVQFSTGALPEASPLWSPRVGFNWDVARQAQHADPRRHRRLHRQAGLRLDLEPDRQHRRADRVRAGREHAELPVHDRYRDATSRRTSPAPRRRASTWRSPTPTSSSRRRGAPTSASTSACRGASSAPPSSSTTRTSTACPTTTPTCRRRRRRSTAPISGSGGPARRARAATATPCVTRINNAAGNQITNAIVLTNSNAGRSWNFAGSVKKNLEAGLSVQAAYSYGESKTLIDPGSIAAGSFTGNAIFNDPNNPELAYSASSPGHRTFINATYTKNFFGWGSTSVSMFWNAFTNGNTSYVFSGDMNGDTASGNDLIYIPRDQSEMSFAQFTTGTGASARTFTAQQQAEAFEQYIQNDPYLREHRGEYAKRNAVFLPQVKRMDLSLVQDVFKGTGTGRHGGQIRLDITNFGNLLNSDWGVSQRIRQNQILTNAGVDAAGRLTYRMALQNGDLFTQPYQTNAGIADVYVMMLSFRYTFN